MEIRSTESFLEYYEKIRGRTRRIVRLIPRDRIDWTYEPGRFTFADLIRHIAGTERWMFAENVEGRPSRYPGHDRRLADGYDAALEYFDSLHQESMEIFSSLTDERLLERCTTPGGGELAVWKWLRAMVEHEIHHRGQIYLYLSMIGVATPPLFGLTSEQVKERSES